MNKKEINILKKCSKNVLQFSHFVKILTDHGLDNFKPYLFQKKLLKKFSDSLKPENTGRRNHIVIAPRQSGKTTIIAVYILWYMIFNPDKCIGLISYKLDAAKEILRTIREIYANLPDFIKPVATRNNTEMLKFENHTYVMVAPPRRNSVCGRSIDLLVVDEAAYIKKRDFDDFMLSVFPTQCGRRDAQMILISTPHGDNQFYEIYKHAVSGISSFIATRLRYNCVPGRDEEFKEKAIRDNGRSFFEQEYNAAFVISKEIPSDEKIVIKVNTNPLSPAEAKGFMEKLKELYSKKLDIKTIKNKTEYEIEYI